MVVSENPINDENERPVRSSSPIPSSSRRTLAPTAAATARGASAKKHISLSDRPFPVNAIILSAQFWPQLKEEKLELPPEVNEALAAYTKAYERNKGNRTLVRVCKTVSRMAGVFNKTLF